MTNPKNRRLDIEQPSQESAIEIMGLRTSDSFHPRPTPDQPYQGTQPNQGHGPQNADHELRKAYNEVILAGLTCSSVSSQGNLKPDLKFQNVIYFYKHAFRKYRDNQLVSAERWAHATLHLAKAFFLESKIEFLEKHSTDLPFLTHASAEDYGLIHQKSDTVADLLDSVSGHVPIDMEAMPDLMERCLSRAREHLQKLDDPQYHHELLRADRIKVAYHYGRFLEVIALAHQADHTEKAAS